MYSLFTITYFKANHGGWKSGEWYASCFEPEFDWKPDLFYWAVWYIPEGYWQSIKRIQPVSNSQNYLPAINLIIVGPADHESDQLRNDLCKELNLDVGSQVSFAGKVEEAERNRILSTSKVYIHLSRFEGFGLSVIQALSAFKPVIVSRQVPTSDIINNYKAGIVVNSTEEIASAIAAVFALTDEEYIQMARNARLCYEEQFHPDVIKPKLFELYNKAALISVWN